MASRRPTGPVKKRKSILRAIAEADRLGDESFLRQYGYGHAREYVLVHDSKRYDSKAIYGVARRFEAPERVPLKPSEFSGGEATVARWLKELRFTVIRDTQQLALTPGQTYRRTALHRQYGGQRQGGISTPSKHPMIFLITGESGELYGYKDGPRPDGTFWYTGEGQVGDMQMVRGNAAIRDHQKNGKALHLFEDAGSGMLRYVSEASYLGHHTEVARDRKGRPRKAIVFELALEALPQGTGRTSLADPVLKSPADLKRKSLAELRQLALEASPRDAPPAERKANVYRRSQAVREYVLRRANGMCEACGAAAPFAARDGRPYLEPHHIRRRADGGPDHPRWVAGICPNCHRHVHSGQDGEAYNAQIADKIGDLERDA